MTLRPYAIGAIAGAALTLALLWALEPEPVPEPPAAAVPLPSGGIVAERLPPPAELPRVAEEAAEAVGGRPERVGSITIQPDPPPPAPAIDGLCLCKPAPIDIDWALVSDRAGGQRFALEVDGGTVTEASDRPMFGVRRDRQTRWAAGLTWLPTENTGGAWIERDIGRARIGAEALVWEGRLVPAVRFGWGF